MEEMVQMQMGGPKNMVPTSFAGPFGQMDMGGMFTVLKVRQNLTDYRDPGWYQYPEGTIASLVKL